MTRYKVEGYFTQDKRWDNLAFVIDNENADNENCYLNLKEVVGLLNTLHTENQQLKHYKLYEDNKSLQTKIADLKQENEQLRQTKKILQQEINDAQQILEMLSDKLKGWKNE